MEKLVEYFEVVNNQACFIRCPRHHAESFAKNADFACLLTVTDGIPHVGKILKGDDSHSGYRLASDFSQDNLV